LPLQRWCWPGIGSVELRALLHPGGKGLSQLELQPQISGVCPPLLERLPMSVSCTIRMTKPKTRWLGLFQMSQKPLKSECACRSTRFSLSTRCAQQFDQPTCKTQTRCNVYNWSIDNCHRHHRQATHPRALRPPAFGTFITPPFTWGGESLTSTFPSIMFALS
jgi:hypothetical protein